MRALIVKVAFGLIGVAVALGATGSAWAQDGTEERLRAMEERLLRQEREIRELREALAGQKSEDDSLQAELDRYLAKAEDEPWWQEPNTLRAYWDRGIRLATSDGAFKLKIGGRIMYDTAFYDPDSQYEDDFPEIRGMSHLNEFRRARIYFQGTIHENVYFKMQYDFAKGDAGFRDMYIGLQKLPIVGHFQVGNMKEPFSLEETVEILKKGRGVHFDPALLDRFLEMAPALYEELSGREDKGLRQEVDGITQRYFSEDTEVQFD